MLYIVTRKVSSENILLLSEILQYIFPVILVCFCFSGVAVICVHRG